MKNYYHTNRSKIIIGLLLALFIPHNFILALVSPASQSVFHQEVLTASQLKTGATLNLFNNDFKVILPANEKAESDVSVELGQLNENLDYPWNLNKLSQVYQFDFKPGTKKEFTLRLNYQEEAKLQEYKQIFFYDKNSATWKPLISKDYPEKKYVEARTSLSFARVAVFSYPQILVTGQASWYAYKGGNFAASPDFPKGSRLRVTNLANGKFIDVTVNDYGPNRLRLPNRVIDLDKQAFKKIASLGAGLVNVKVEPLEIKADSAGRILGLPKSGAAIQPTITSEAAIVFRESDQKVLWEKNSAKVLPLASLTKLVAVKTFLDEGSNRERLNEKVSYNVQDEKYNYEYCSANESAKIKLQDGDQLTIKDLIYSALVGSANNAVESLVRVSGLSRSEFIARMNEKVESWGTEGTHFVEPTGLSPQNISSVKDYAFITQAVSADQIIQLASVTMQYKFSNLNNQKPHTINNTNRLLGLYRYPITGSKTGYLEEAGYCLMTRIKLGNDNLVIVTFKSKDRNASFSETEELMRYGLNQAKNSIVKAAAIK